MRNHNVQLRRRHPNFRLPQSLRRAVAPIGLIFVVMALALAACSGQSEPPTPEPTATPETFPPRELTVLVGAGERTAAINAFFPQRLNIRAGDTVTWKMNTEGDPHSIIFTDQPPEDDVIPVPGEGGSRGDTLFGGGGPGPSMLNPKILFPTRDEGTRSEVWRGSGYITSGIMFPKLQQPPDIPLIDSFSLNFDRPGVYPYVCGMHDFHKGVIVVEEATAEDVPEQDEIDRSARKEIEPLEEITNSLHVIQSSDRVLDKELGPGGTSLYVVAAGMGPPDAELTEFFPGNLTIKKGDTVVWVSSRWHSIVFNPGGPFPPMYTPETDDTRRVQMIINPIVTLPVKAGQPFLGRGHLQLGVDGVRAAARRRRLLTHLRGGGPFQVPVPRASGHGGHDHRQRRPIKKRLPKWETSAQRCYRWGGKWIVYAGYYRCQPAQGMRCQRSNAAGNSIRRWVQSLPWAQVQRVAALLLA